MKLYLILGASTLAFASAANAQNASFAGPYVGIQAGIGQIDDYADDPDCWYACSQNAFTSDRGALVGLRVGYDFQLGALLAGVLAEGSIGTLDSFEEASPDPTDPHFAKGTKIKRIGSVRAKLGIASGNLAAFVTGGLALAGRGTQTYRETDGTGEFYDGRGDRSGYVLGFGVAHAFGRSVIGLDYSHYDFGSERHILLNSVGVPNGFVWDQDYRVRTLQLSYNYRFGGSAAAPTEATASFGGPYIGAQVAFGMLDNDNADLDCWYACSTVRNSDNGVLGGIRAGFDFQSGMLLAGVLVEGSLGTIDSFQEMSPDSTNPTFAVGTRVTKLGSARAKLGVANGNLAIYATGGLAVSNAKQRFRETDGSGQLYDGKGDRSGYVVGLGAAYAITGNSTLALDYSHYEFGSRDHLLLNGNGTSTGFIWSQKYKIRALTLSFNYGF